MSAETTKAIEPKKSLRQLFKLSIYPLLAFWLLTVIVNTLSLSRQGLDPFALEAIKEMPLLSYLLAAVFSIIATLALVYLPLKIDELLLKFFLLAAIWLFLLNLWYLALYLKRPHNNLPLAAGIVLLALLTLFYSRYYLLLARDRGYLYYLAWFFFSLVLLFTALALGEFVMALFSAPAAADNNLMINLVLSLILIFQGAIAGGIAAYLFPDARIYGKARLLTGQKNRLPLFLLLAAAVHIVLFAWILAARTNILSTPSYDFGIFAQMFHNMAKSGLPTTTLERSYQLSHFSVHLSPVFYLLLPLYWLTRSAALLQIAQIVLVASGVIPLLLICKKLNWPKRRALVFSLLYLSYPALSGSSMYNLHENFFLAPFILWLLYFVLKQQILPIYLMAILILTVKEDAALYLLAISLWLFLTKRIERIHSSALLLLASLWFVFSLFYLSRYGLGPMTGRYNNLIVWPELGLINMFTTFIFNPLLVISKIFTADKLNYLLQMLVPLAFLPFARRINPDYILVLPWLILNLLSDYSYQHNINFQYHYGTGVLLIFVSMLTLDELFKDSPGYYSKSLPRQVKLRQKKQSSFHFFPFARHYTSKSYLALCLLAGIMLTTSIFFGARIYSRHRIPLASYKSQLKIAEEMKREMAQIPESASVRASTMLTTYLAQREKLIDLNYEELENAEKWEADYIVVDQRYGRRDQFEERIMTAIARGYLVQVDLPGKILILKHPDYLD